MDTWDGDSGSDASDTCSGILTVGELKYIINNDVVTGVLKDLS